MSIVKQLGLGSLWNLEHCLVSWLEMHCRKKSSLGAKKIPIEGAIHLRSYNIPLKMTKTWIDWYRCFITEMAFMKYVICIPLSLKESRSDHKMLWKKCETIVNIRPSQVDCYKATKEFNVLLCLFKHRIDIQSFWHH